MNQKVSYDNPRDEVFRVNNLEVESHNKLDDIEKLMEEELKAWKKPHIVELNVPNKELQFI